MRGHCRRSAGAANLRPYMLSWSISFHVCIIDTTSQLLDCFGCRCLQKVLDLNWHASTRVLVHLADYPCHGRQYHDYTSVEHDAHMDGDPSGSRQFRCCTSCCCI